ncbi:2,4-dichlorophenol 6-monooxygenase [Achromobacter deleyi]|uniref:2,4-dichlorophenol 6-monooxygenase n=1 Tax=Achromobacter deleyi TaxID=1353891 RepID=A0A6S7A1Y4_9BURK|nr:FAD-dependent monooxygenase [Achromobacter deleyi]CAB3708542.1 2,4-dichlorophenol 6-monooxygenase [Achromobacter deleyi]CAB3866758.1 2,4-dichlorophenol 6-monooxygenase [Achromobacter deleyi]CAB3877527.1 2,4-dichlorophenol 6-monooxygenase [Achromobacter deleyi]
MTSTYPVIIVGAGPVGLALALDLGWRGIPSLVLEKGDGAVAHPRTGLIAVRTMEFFRRWGMADRLRDCGFPKDYALSIEFCTSLQGHTLERDDYPSMAQMPTPAWTPEKKQRCPQQWMDPILKQELRRQGQAELRLHTEVTGFEDTGDDVIVTARDHARGEPVTFRGRYLVGCDGAGSVVRRQLDIPMVGNAHINYSMSILFACPGLLGLCRRDAAERFLLIGPEGTWGNLTVIDGDALWRLTVYGTADKFDLEHFDAAAYVRRALGETPGAAIPFTIQSVLPWKRTELVAQRYQMGRALLAGDAVHTMSPTGGMGMNTGMGDAVDLGWKLDAMLRGWGGASLLASYGLERRPIAVRNAAYSTRNFQTWTSAPRYDRVLEDDPQAHAQRRLIGADLKRATTTEWQSWGLQVGYRYENSPICIPDGTPPTPDDYSRYQPTSRPGARAPHAWLDAGRSTLDLYGRGYALLAFAGAHTGCVASLHSAAACRGVPLAVTPIADESIHELYEAPLVLVRPDGHVAWRGAHVDNAPMIIDIARGAL